MIPFDISKFQPRAWGIISRSFKADRIAGTYLFHATEGSGDWMMAISLAALLNCENPQEISDKNILPCGECRNCNNMFSYNFEALYFALPLPPHKKEDDAIDLSQEIIQLKKEEPFKILTSTSSVNIPISVARLIKKNLSRMAPAGLRRVVLFYQMEFMKTASADALLKMIEEPPTDTVIILTADRPEVLLPTIQSRSQKIKLDRVSEQVITEYLTANYEVSEEKAQLLSKISEGIPGRAIEMLSQDDESDTSGRSVGFYLFKSFVYQESYDLVSHMNEMMDMRNRSYAVELLNLWQSLIRDCAAFAIDGNEANLINIDFSVEIKKMSEYFSNPNKSLKLAEEIKITLADLRRNVHIQGALTAVALRLKSDLRMSR